MMFVRKLSKVEHLRMYHIRDVPPIRTTSLAALAEFTSITRVEITATIFPSLNVFGQILSNIPNLTTLICASIRWTRTDYNRQALSRSGPRLRLRYIAMSFVPWSTDVVDWLLAITTVESIDTVNIRRMLVEDMVHVTRLLEEIGPSLKHLAIGFEADEDEYKPHAIGSLARNDRLLSIHLEFIEKGAWIYPFLSQVKSTHLRRVTISTPARSTEAQLDHIRCDLVDAFLSDPNRVHMDAVVFQYRSRMTTEWTRWFESEIQRRCPRLWARGIVHIEPSCYVWWYLG